MTSLVCTPQLSFLTMLLDNLAFIDIRRQRDHFATVDYPSCLKRIPSPSSVLRIPTGFANHPAFCLVLPLA